MGWRRVYLFAHGCGCSLPCFFAQVWRQRFAEEVVLAQDDYMYENQREGSGEARETARGGADDAMEGRRAVEGGGPGDATEGGEGGRRRRGKRKVGDG